MKLYNFDLLAYPHVPKEAPRTPVPSSFFDPIKGAANYAEHLEEMTYCEELGFDGVVFNEHHYSAYGTMPSPNLIASALSQRTKKIKIGVLGNILPLRNHPVRVAEEYAMIDCLSNGRLIAGFVRGIPPEYIWYGVNPAESRGRFQEAYELIMRAWKEPVWSYEGKFFKLHDCAIWPRPMQQPHPPIWIPSQGSRETIEWASHPSRRYTYLQTFSPAAALAKYMAMYKEEAEKRGYSASPMQLGWSVPVYAADTDERAYREAKPHIENLVNKFLRMPAEMLLPPGYLSLQSMKGVMSAKGTITGATQTIDDLLKKGMFLCGSPETLRQQIEEYQKQIGFGYLLPMLQFATLPRDLTKNNLEIFARKIIPALRPLGEALVQETSKRN